MPANRTNGFRCSSCGERFVDIAPTYSNHYNSYCEPCFNRYFYHCGDCGRVAERGMCRPWIVNGEEVHLCRDCLHRRTVWDASEFSTENVATTETKTSRRFGVELETSSCPQHCELHGATIFGSKYDCSVAGMEFTSPILAGDEGLKAIQDFCALANERHFEVDRSCGYHLHLDMRNESDDQLKSVAYAYLKADKVWRHLVDEYRSTGCSYCRTPEWGRRQLENIPRGEMRGFCECRDRYSLCNLQAYWKFGTYEIRLHQGSLDALEICNWIKAHLRFVEWARDKTFDEIDDAFRGSDNAKWESLKAILGDINLNRYYGRKRRTRLGIAPKTRKAAAARAR
jgi:hypothetical protein